MRPVSRDYVKQKQLLGSYTTFLSIKQHRFQSIWRSLGLMFFPINQHGGQREHTIYITTHLRWWEHWHGIQQTSQRKPEFLQLEWQGHIDKVLKIRAASQAYATEIAFSNITFWKHEMLVKVREANNAIDAMTAMPSSWSWKHPSSSISSIAAAAAATASVASLLEQMSCYTWGSVPFKGPFYSRNITCKTKL